MKEIKISINQLLEFVCMSGDLGVVASLRALQRGIRVHQQYQEKFLEEEREVPVKLELERSGVLFQLQGRIDLLCLEDKHLVVKELKSTTSLEKYLENYSKKHLLQAIFYCYMLCVQNELNEIKAEVIYIEEKTLDTKTYDFTYSLEQLEKEVIEILDFYIEWVKFLERVEEDKQLAIKSTKFPFPEFRKYQKKLIKEVYHNIEEQKIIFVNAPTGIGKSISILLASIKGLKHFNEKIFYLTAKNTGKESLKKAYEDMLITEGKIRCVIITAKEKMCINREFKCDAINCQYAKGFYDNIAIVIKEILENETLLEENNIKEYGEKYSKCPFELSLLLAEYSTIVCADYNYFFDPMVKLQRFFTEEVQNILLVDEAHNLYKRACNMYTEIIDVNFFIEAKNIAPKGVKKKWFDKCINCLELIEVEEKEDFKVVEKVDSDLLYEMSALFNAIDALLENENDILKEEPFRNFYYYLKRLLTIIEEYDENFATYYINEFDNFIIKIACLLPNKVITQKINYIRSVTFFSGTLLPMNYYEDILLDNKEISKLLIPPIFPQENLEIIICNYIGTKYHEREQTKFKLLKCITNFIKATKGNTIIFFPSFRYMEMIYDILDENTKEDILIQKKAMSDYEKELFISEFKNTSRRVVAFAVIGGVFSEGVDFIGEMLENIAIVGIGLPSFNTEHKQKSSFFQEKFNNGYKYSSLYVGISKVLQAVGRVIRDENDKGKVLLIDERYFSIDVRQIIFSYWQNCKLINSEEKFKKTIEELKSNVK